VHQILQQGNIQRASRALAAAPPVQPTAEVMEQLAQLHPAAHVPEVPSSGGVPLQVSRAQLRKVVQNLPTGSAPVPSGWNFEHVAAIPLIRHEGLDAVLELVKAFLPGSLPPWEAMRASPLVPQKKGLDKVQPVAVEEVWLHLTGQCAMTACIEVARKLTLDKVYQQDSPLLVARASTGPYIWSATGLRQGDPCGPLLLSPSSLFLSSFERIWPAFGSL
jgi:hypothetical protein